MIIAFMGNDGGGKTTIAKEFVKIFRDLGFEVIYKHEYEYTILKLLFRAVGMEKIRSERKKMIVEREKSWKYYLWPFLVWFDIHCSLVFFKLFKRKAIVILDRYLYDHYLSFKYLGYLTGLSELLYTKFSLKPDIAFVLWIEPRIAYLRKKSTHNYDITFYVEQTKRYIELSKMLRLNAVNTNKSVLDTVNEIFMRLPEDKLTYFLRKGMQNRVLFSVIKKYGLNSAWMKFNQALDETEKKLKKTFTVVKDLFERSGVEKYCVVKTLTSEGWMGNDVDILVSKSDFGKIIVKLKELNTSKIVLIQKFAEKGKVDIHVQDGFTIDLHSYIGWRNVVFIPSEDVINKNLLVKKRNDIYFAGEKINSIIISLTHVFEKGFVTLDEYNYLRNHFDETFMQTNFPHLRILLSDYISWITKTLREKRNRSYPLFIPMPIIIKCYLELLFYSKNGHSNVFWKLKAFVRDISFMIFWRIRYVLKSKLPFEVAF
jgi:thymidylate kinase